MVLGGCFLPASVQIASLFADGVSLAATDKTLSDHGLSAVNKQDCALWRIVNGEDVCRDYEPDGPVMVADAKPDEPKVTEETLPPPGPIDSPENILVDAEDINLTGAPKIEVASLDPVDLPVEPETPPAIEAVPDAPILAAAETPLPAKPAPAPNAVKTRGGTFYVIASFSRLDRAKRFAGRHATLAMQVLSGTARGKTVYRVATGPIGKSHRPTTRAKLTGAGFDDAWALTLKTPQVAVDAVELASLN